MLKQKLSPPAIASDLQSQRILSIDALRGFDMFWIIGGTLLFPALDQIFHSPITAWLSIQSEHSAWDQPHLLDIIFPLFLFIVGLVLPISIDRQLSKGDSLVNIHMRTFKRALVLLILGMLAKGLSTHFTIKFGVLSRIGFAYYVAALLVLHTSWRFQTIVTAVILIAAALAMTLIPIASLHDAAYINKDIATVLPVTAECVRWILSVPSVLFGVLAGHYLRCGHSGTRKTLMLALAGICSVILSFIVEPFIPRIFFLWTSSFVLYTAGISLVLFAIFYWIIDVKSYRKWTFFFVVIGMNAVLIYFLRITSLIDFQNIADFFLAKAAGCCGPYKELIRVSGFLGAEWLFLYFLYKRNIFLKA